MTDVAVEAEPSVKLRVTVISVVLVVSIIFAVVIAIQAPTLAIHTFKGHGSQLLRNGQFAYAATGIACLSIALFWFFQSFFDFPRKWLVLSIAYSLLIVYVKFVLSPLSYEMETSHNIGQFLAVGGVVFIFYLLAFFVMYSIVNRSSSITWLSRCLGVLAVVALLAVARYVAVPLIGAKAKEYLHHVFAASGLILPIAIVLAAILAFESFVVIGASNSNRQRNLRLALVASLSVVIVLHIGWAFFMHQVYA